MLKFKSVSVIRSIWISCKIREHSTFVSDNIVVSLANKYVPDVVEVGKYEKWEKRGYFAPKSIDEDGKIFSIILPPPNITGSLHLGHALTVTVEDILCRWKRMQGYSVLWVPGTDHAGIATQIVVEKYLFNKTGKTRREVGRKVFFEYLLEWKSLKMNRITDQLKKLGASVDWSMYTFTMDPIQSTAVTEAVIRLFEDDMIFHENSLVNWCSHLQSTISDVEIDYQEIEEPMLLKVPGLDQPVECGLLYNFAMKVISPECENDEEIITSTTRPETVFGDVAIAVHPDDARYNHLKGKFVYHPFRECPIPVIFDEFVDREFGTGAVKITPGQSKVDFDVSKRHNLPLIAVFNELGQLNENCKNFTGIHRFEARNQIIRKLSDLGLLRDVKKHRIRIPICSRSGDIIEQMIKPQWYLKCDELSKKVIEVIENGDLIIDPKSRLPTCLEWLKNMKVWCLSRQLWWGHRLPLYKADGDWIAAKSLHEAKVKYMLKHRKECSEISQENDVLDTWFSSALLPFSVFGWPVETENFNKFYPLSLMETGADILNFWVVRMAMLGLYFTNQLPFKKVSLHSMICDNRGRKMSKSLGNVIEPEYIINGMSLMDLKHVVETSHSEGVIPSSEIQKILSFLEETFPEGIHSCGVDALRLTLAQFVNYDHHINFNSQECHENWLLCNKLWQASKFCLGWASFFNLKLNKNVEPMFSWQLWLLHRLYHTVNVVNTALENHNFTVAVSSLKNFLYDDFCSVSLELSKPILKSGSSSEGETNTSILLYTLETYLRLLSPFMPFITDEIYTHIPDCSTTLVGECSYPQIKEYIHWNNDTVNNEMVVVQKIIRSTRTLLKEMRCKNSISDVVVIPKKKNFVSSYQSVIQTLVRCRSLEVREFPTDIVGLCYVAGNIANVYVIVENLTENHLNMNYNFLNEQILHFCSIINSRINVDGEKYYHTSSDNLFEEWKNFESELNNSIEKLKSDPITLECIKKMIHVLEIIQEFNERFKICFKKTHHS